MNDHIGLVEDENELARNREAQLVLESFVESQLFGRQELDHD